MKVHFHVYFCLKLHDFTPFKPKFDPRSPPPQSVPERTQTFTILKQLCRMCLGWGENTGEVIYMKSFVSKAISMDTLDFDPTNPE